MSASLQTFTRRIHDTAQRAAAVYADLRPLDSPAGAWDLSVARVGRTIALVLAWCIFQIAQWPAFTWLAPRAQVLRVRGTVIETVKALEAPAAATVEEPVDWSDAQVQAPFPTLPLLYRATLPVEQLRRALQQALSLYPRFAGRMVSHKDGSKYWRHNNGGVALHISSSPDTLDDLMPAQPSRFFVAPDLRSAFGQHLPLLSGDILNTHAPPLRVAIVHLAGGGTLVAVAGSHMVGDARTLRSFLEHWAAAANGTALLDGPPVHADLQQLRQGREVAPGPKGSVPKSILVPGQPGAIAKAGKELLLGLWQGGGSVTLYVHVPKTRLRQLKNEAIAGLQSLQQAGVDVGDGWVSTNDALLARVWQVMSGLPQRTGASFPIGIAVDMRKRLLPPLSPHVVGNIIQLACTEARDAALLPLGRLAWEVRRSVLSAPQDYLFKERYLAEQRSKGELDGIIPSFMQGPHRIMDARHGTLLCSNWDLDYPSLAFGAGADAQPVWLSLTNVDLVALLDVVVVTQVPPMSPLGEDGGRVVMLSLTKANARALLARHEGL